VANLINPYETSLTRRGTGVNISMIDLSVNLLVNQPSIYLDIALAVSRNVGKTAARRFG
jgi:hypothetical protein